MPRVIPSSRLLAILTLTAGFAFSSLACSSIPFLAPTATFTPTSAPTYVHCHAHPDADRHAHADPHHHANHVVPRLAGRAFRFL